MRNESTPIDRLIRSFLLLAVCLLALPGCVHNRPGGQVAAALPFRADDGDAFGTCVTMCLEETSLALVTRTGCLDGCDQARRMNPWQDQDFSSSRECRDTTAGFSPSAGINTMRRWCDAKWTHVHNRKGCYRAAEAYFNSLNMDTLCGNEVWTSPAGPVDPAPRGPVSAAESLTQGDQPSMVPALPPVSEQTSPTDASVSSPLPPDGDPAVRVTTQSGEQGPPLDVRTRPVPPSGQPGPDPAALLERPAGPKDRPTVRKGGSMPRKPAAQRVRPAQPSTPMPAVQPPARQPEPPRTEQSVVTVPEAVIPEVVISPQPQDQAATPPVSEQPVRTEQGVQAETGQSVELPSSGLQPIEQPAPPQAATDASTLPVPGDGLRTTPIGESGAPLSPQPDSHETEQPGPPVRGLNANRPLPGQSVTPSGSADRPVIPPHSSMIDRRYQPPPVFPEDVVIATPDP